MNTFPQNSAVVLVPGAWADGDCWKELILPLERQGHKVAWAPIQLTSLSDDVSALTRTLERTTGPIVLVGHAYGGAVVGAILEARVKSFVYIAALAPDEGETVAQAFYRDESHPEAPKLAPDKHDFIWMPEDGFSRAVAHKASTDRNKNPGGGAATNFCSQHSRERAGPWMEVESVLVFAWGGGPHDQSQNAAIYGWSNGREGPLRSCGP